MGIREFFVAAKANGAAIYRVDSYRIDTLADVEKLHWSDISMRNPVMPDSATIEVLDECVAVHAMLTYGDYDNSCDVERSNVRFLLGMDDGVSVESEYELGSAVLEMHGGFGSHGVAFRYVEGFSEEALEVLEALEEYPILNEDHNSETRMNMIADAWDSYGSGDFLSFIAGGWSKGEELKESLGVGDDELSKALYDVWYDCTAVHGTGCEEEIEAGGSVFFDHEAATYEIDGREGALQMLRSKLEENNNITELVEQGV